MSCASLRLLAQTSALLRGAILTACHLQGSKIFHELSVLDLGRIPFEGTATERCTSCMDHGIASIRPLNVRNPYTACCCVHRFLAAQIVFSGDRDARSVIIAAIGLDICV